MSIAKILKKEEKDIRPCVSHKKTLPAQGAMTIQMMLVYFRGEEKKKKRKKEQSDESGMANDAVVLTEG